MSARWSGAGAFLALMAATVGALFELGGQKVLPVAVIGWARGMPQLPDGEGWAPVRSVGGLPIGGVVADAVAAHGAGYLDAFPYTLAVALRPGGGPASRWALPWEHLERGDVRTWALSSRWRWREATRWPAGCAPASDQAVAAAGPQDLDRAVLDCLLQTRLASTGVIGDGGSLAWPTGAEAADRLRLARWIDRRLAELGDGHARVRMTESGLGQDVLRLPIRVIPVAEGMACLDLATQTWCHPGCPLLESIGGRRLDALIAAADLAGHGVPASSVARHLSDVDLVAPDAEGPTVLGLIGPDGPCTVSVVPLVEPGPRDGPGVHGDRLRSGVGLLSIRHGWDAGAPFMQALERAVSDLDDAPAWVIDVRGNAGGERLPVLRLIEELVAGPIVVDAAAWRMDRDLRPPSEWDVLAARGLHPPRSPWFSGGALGAAEAAVAQVQGAIPLDGDRWSEWHVAVVEPSPHRGTGYLGPVVVLMDEETASASHLMLTALRGSGRATLVGYATGGGSGWPLTWRLPQSGIAISLPTVLSVSPDGALRTSVQPDVPLTRTVARLSLATSAGVDPDLRSAEQVAVDLMQLRAHPTTGSPREPGTPAGR